MKKIQAFENSKVTLTDSYYLNATNKVVKNILSLDADRLLMGFRENAVLMYQSKKDNPEIPLCKIPDFYKGKFRYGGWENTLIAGHTLGHYLTALAQACENEAVSQDDRNACKEACDYSVAQLKVCQDMTEGTKYEGLVFAGTLPDQNFRDNPDMQFTNVEHRKSDIFKESWVPYYTLHKIMQGLLDVYNGTKNNEALLIAEKLGHWIFLRTQTWNEETRANVLSIEYGGINDVLYQLYGTSTCSYREEFLIAAHLFDEDTLFKKVSKAVPGLMDNTHANTTIPKFMGALQRYNVTGDEVYLEYAKDFWEMVLQNHTYVTGGNSENEHFGKDKILAAERTRVNNETCNTYNMLKLSRNLFEITGEKKYADYYERTYLNAIMASQNPETGCTMYFQPMATGYRKVYSTVDQSFWCCTGTGWENFTKLQDSIFYYSEAGAWGTEKTVFVNNYVSSVLDAGSAKIQIQSNFLNSGDLKISVQGKPDFDLAVRIPEWTQGLTATCGCKNENGFLLFSASSLEKCSSFTITFEMGIKACTLPDNNCTAAFKYGPYVLSACLGNEKQTTVTHGMWVTVPEEKAVQNDDVKVSGKSVEDFLNNCGSSFVQTLKDGVPVFELKNCDRKLSFIPHYLQHTESYGIYWHFI